MGLGRGSSFNEPQPQVFQDGLDDLPVFDEADDPHDSPTLRKSQGIDLVGLLTQPGNAIASRRLSAVLSEKRFRDASACDPRARFLVLESVARGINSAEG